MNIGLGLSHSYERVGLTTTLDNNGNVKFCGGGFDKFRHCYDAGGALGIEAEMFLAGCVHGRDGVSA